MRTSQAFPAHADANGTISPASRSVAHGATIFTVTPETGYSASVSGCGRLTLQAGQRIRFLPGFQVQAGGMLQARIGPSP